MNKKKIISYILMVTMLVSICYIPVNAGESVMETPDTGTVTIHFFNENNWQEPYIYYYSDSDETHTWPGIPMTAENNGWYSCTVREFSQVRVIFSDHGKNQFPAQNQKGFLVSGEMWYKNGQFYKANPDTESTTIHFYNTDGWQKPSIYYYTEDNIPADWPGTEMFPEGDGWYFYDIPGHREVNVLFSDNGINQIPESNQTGYTVSGERWFVNGIWYDSEPEADITVHFYNYDNWNQVNLYYYSEGQTGADWSGAAMTPEEDGWFTYKIFGYKEVAVLFNNGSGIQILGIMEPGFPVKGEMWYRNGTWTAEHPAEITVYFYKPESWSCANLYYYKTENDTGPAWPGTVMKSVGSNWYTCTITKYDSAKVMFNDGNSQIPGSMQPGFDASGMMWYRDGIWCDSETDTDTDGLADYLELVYGTDIDKIDTDGDGLSDGQEVYLTGTDPAKYDSVRTGISDAETDMDGDGLSNRRELELGTNPLEADTDEDDLSDGEEVNRYFTNPLIPDTDGDSLKDGDDVALGFSPLLPDTNGNGILDCDEKIRQSLTQEVTEPDKPEVTQVTVQFNGTGNITSTTTIKSIYNIDILSREVAGQVGAPIEITSTSEFDQAVISFHVGSSAVDNETLSNLTILWYDEENHQFVTEDSTVDMERRTVSATVHHFSKYMLVDKREWFSIWSQEIDYTDGVSLSYDTIIAIDCSGSMSLNDPAFEYTYRDTLYPGSVYTVATCYRKLAAENFIQAQDTDNRTAVVTFDSSASIACDLTNSILEAVHALDGIYSSGGTDFEIAIQTSVNVLNNGNREAEKMILFLSDGEDSVSQTTLDNARDSGITIHTVYIGSGSESPVLKQIAEQTGGEYFKAVTAEDLIQIYSQIAINQTIDGTDRDNDGIPDIFETAGMRLPNGKIIYSDPTKADTDGDGLKDGEEIIPVPIPYFKSIPDANGKLKPVKGYLFLMRSNPNLKDSDGDGLQDGSARYVNGKKVIPKDPEPLSANGPVGIWQEQYRQEVSGKRIAHKLGTWYKMDWNIGSIFAGIGSRILNFKSDEKNIAVHSQVKTWQAIGGYNNIYDSIFEFGTNGNMRKVRFDFTYNNEKYAIWTWRGDYLNLGSGAEIGIYQNPHDFFGVIQWDVADFRLPMTLNLYNYYGKNQIENIFCWAPIEKQWWITGFNPNIKPVAKNMVSLGSIDFKGREGMFEALKKYIEKDEKLNDFMIFDEDGHTVWLIWWEASK